MIIISIIFYFFAFFIIWFAAGLIVKVVEKLSFYFNLSSFAVSFFILGILTSTPELAVGISSIIDKKPEIFVGNLLGGSLILFILIIPILAIFGNGVKLTHQLNQKNLILSLLITAAPSFFVLDSQLNFYEGLFLIFIYSYLFYSIEKKKGLLEKIRDEIFHPHGFLILDLLKLILGFILLIFSSKFIVDKTIFFSKILGISPFLISLLFLSVGTNLPELSLALRAVLLGKKEVAFGDYIGSAAANTLIFGLLTLVSGNIVLADGFLKILFFMIFGFGLFFYFSRSKNDISKDEGIILILVYILFLISEIF